MLMFLSAAAAAPAKPTADAVASAAPSSNALAVPIILVSLPARFRSPPSRPVEAAVEGAPTAPRSCGLARCVGRCGGGLAAATKEIPEGGEAAAAGACTARSEEHTSELQS